MKSRKVADTIFSHKRRKVGEMMSSHQRQHDIIFITAIQMKGWCRFSENATATCAEAISSSSRCLAIPWMSHICVSEADPDNLFISGETQKNLSPFIKFHFWQRRLNINDYINLFSASALFLSSFHEVRWTQLSCFFAFVFIRHDENEELANEQHFPAARVRTKAVVLSFNFPCIHTTSIGFIKLP